MRKKSQARGREREGKARAQLKRLTFWGHVAGAVLHVPLVCLAACLAGCCLVALCIVASAVWRGLCVLPGSNLAAIMHES